MQYLRHFIPQTIQMLLGILLLLIFFNQILLLEWVLFGKRIPGFRCSEWLQNKVAVGNWAGTTPGQSEVGKEVSLKAHSRPAALRKAFS